MVMDPNNPNDLERLRKTARTQTLPNVGPVRQAPRPGFTYQPGTPGYQSLNLYQKAGLQPHYSVPNPAPKPAVVRPAAPTAPASAPAPASKPPIQQLYEFLKGDLTREATKERAAAEVDASRRGVFYGQPLTAMGTDIDERYQRGLATLQASLIQNEQQNELERLRVALSSLGPLQQAETPAFPAEAFQNLAAAFAQQPTGAPPPPPQAPPPSYQRVGDKVIPKPKQRVD